jgi:hypothetical protein
VLCEELGKALFKWRMAKETNMSDIGVAKEMVQIGKDLDHVTRLPLVSPLDLLAWIVIVSHFFINFLQ